MSKLFLSLCIVCVPFLTEAQTDWIAKYSGAYGISPDGIEAYALRPDRTCSWIYGWKEGGQIKTKQKSGSWSAKEGYIRIAINGNTGVIVEEYYMRNGKFVNKDSSSRYLMKK